MSLEEGAELEAALRLVDPREYIPLLDELRDSPEKLREFVTTLAKENPAVFLKYAKSYRDGLTPANMSEIRRLLDAERKIEAIKYVRKMTGKSLKDAKDFIDELSGE